MTSGVIEIIDTAEASHRQDVPVFCSFYIVRWSRSLITQQRSAALTGMEHCTDCAQYGEAVYAQYLQIEFEHEDNSIGKPFFIWKPRASKGFYNLSLFEL